MSKLFPTYEVGSMPKLNARVKAFMKETKNKNSNKDIEDIISYSSKTNTDPKEVIQIFEKQKRNGERLTRKERKTIIDFNALLNIRLQEKSGLDFVYDGEARRSEMYRNVSRLIEGFEDFPEMIRSRGPDSWRASICIDEPKLNKSIDELPIIKEFEFVKKNAKKAIKVPIDDPYMISNMSGNKYYKEILKEHYKEDPRELRYEAKRELTLALAKNIIRPQVKAVVDKGAKWIQLDAPAATIDIEHIPIMVEGINSVVKNIEDTKFSLHICYPRRVSLTEKKGYELLFPHILKLNPKVNHLSLEMANGNQYKEDLAPFVKYLDQRKFEIGLGVIDITLEKQQKNVIEKPEEIRQRIIYAANLLKDPALIYVAPDCGVRQLSLERSIQLYDTMVEGVDLAKKG